MGEKAFRVWWAESRVSQHRAQTHSSVSVTSFAFQAGGGPGSSRRGCASLVNVVLGERVRFKLGLHGGTGFSKVKSRTGPRKEASTGSL